MFSCSTCTSVLRCQLFCTTLTKISFPKFPFTSADECLANTAANTAVSKRSARSQDPDRSSSKVWDTTSLPARGICLSSTASWLSYFPLAGREQKSFSSNFSQALLLPPQPWQHRVCHLTNILFLTSSCQPHHDTGKPWQCPSCLQVRPAKPIPFLS